jgi:MFS family permease
VRRRRELILLETANLIAGTANSLVLVVIPWLIIERTGSAAAAGVAGALMGIPGIVVAPLVGTLIDRLGRKTISVGSDVLSALSVLMFPVAEMLGRLDLAVIFGLTLLGAVFDPAGYTARKALIPEVSKASRADVAWVNGLHEGLFALGWVIGPALGAAAIATVGSVNAFWLAFGAFLIGAAAIAATRVANRAPTHAGSDDPRASGFWHNTREGIRVLIADRPVLAFTLAIAVISLLYMPTESVLLPLHFEALDQPGAFGVTLSVMAGGAALTALGYGWLAARVPRSVLARSCIILACAAYFPLALLPPVWVMLVAGLLLGAAWGPMDPLLNSLVQDRYPPAQHGRVYGLQLSVFYAAPPIGELVVGFAVTGFGIRAIFLALGVLLLVTAIAVGLLPALRGLDERRGVVSRNPYG